MDRRRAKLPLRQVDSVPELARYTERTDQPDMYAPQSYRRASLTLRYDIDAKSAFKVQADRQKDVTHNFGGDVTVLRLAYDRLF
ncbi:hypothetical protein LP419_15955 [Massilia sp. H-1]|nr:hypothetical protein LP419_15955 [Massilia sp. H-1]